VPAVLEKRPHHVLKVVLANVFGIGVEPPHLLDSRQKSARAVKLMSISGVTRQSLNLCHHGSAKGETSPILGQPHTLSFVTSPGLLRLA
jgi:hypothetical protein